tara:strand:- start:31 stop:558 length:528 start_codon:yes stop_codon:yes gene_type:complete
MALIKLNNQSLTSITADGLPSSIPSSKLDTIDVTKLGSGAVIQTVQKRQTSSTTVNSTSLTYTGLFITITPKSASSRILLIAKHGLSFSTHNGAGRGGGSAWYRGTTRLGDNQGLQVYDAHSGGHRRYTTTIIDSDTPNTTSATDYRIYFKTYNTGASMKTNESVCEMIAHELVI